MDVSYIQAAKADAEEKIREAIAELELKLAGHDISMIVSIDHEPIETIGGKTRYYHEVKVKTWL